MENVLSSQIPGYNWGRNIFSLPTAGEINNYVVRVVNLLDHQEIFNSDSSLFLTYKDAMQVKSSVYTPLHLMGPGLG